MARIVEYVCLNAAHRPALDVPDSLFAHDGALAYCPSGSAGAHDWAVTGGRTIATVREWLGRQAAMPMERAAAHDAA